MGLQSLFDTLAVQTVTLLAMPEWIDCRSAYATREPPSGSFLAGKNVNLDKNSFKINVLKKFAENTL